MQLITTQVFQKLYVIDEPIVALGIKTLLMHLPAIEVIGCAYTVSSAYDKLAKMTPPPDLVITELVIDGKCGFQFIKQLRMLHPKLNILVYTRQDEFNYGFRALNAGARGFISKRGDMKEFVTSVLRMLRGDMVASDRLIGLLLHRVSKANSRNPFGTSSSIEMLSDRELEVFRMIGTGLSTRVVAQRLCLSIKTVESHRAHIKEKLGLRNAPELVQQAVTYMATVGAE